MDIELYGLRIFDQVMKQKSFSGAARALKLTQPTVSQQIAKLEREMKQRLFERVGHDIIPTQPAQTLFLFSSQMIEQMDEFTQQVQESQSQPKGNIRYAMPESCQWTPHYRKIMSQIAVFPDLKFEIEILPNDLIAKGLVEGHYDFGFLTGERLSPQLRFEKFSEEAYSAVASRAELLKPLQSGDVENLRLVTYPGWELFFTTWAKSHGLWKPLKDKLTKPTVRIGSLAGAIHATQEGAGVAIIPTHCIAKELAAKTLIEWKSSKGTIASSPVYLAKRIGENFPKRVELVVNLLKQAKHSLG